MHRALNMVIRRANGVAVFVFSAMLAVSPHGFAQDCNDPGAQCQGIVTNDCLSRVGAGSLPVEERTEAQEIKCGALLDAYRACLAKAIEACPNTGGQAGGQQAGGQGALDNRTAGAAAWNTPPGHQVLGTASFRGSDYAVVSSANPIGWNEARSAARDMGGHLLSISDPDENAAILRLLRTTPAAFSLRQIFLVSASVGPWIGGHQGSNAAEPGGGWRWDDGSSFTFSNWKPGEPNDLFGEDFVVIYCRRNVVCTEWNDASGQMFPVTSYIVER